MNIHITRHLIAEEGLRLEPYQDHLGFWTIGVGHLIDSRKGGKLPTWLRAFPISPDAAEMMLKEDVEKIERGLFGLEPWMIGLSKVRQAVFISMAFQMGIKGLLKFNKTLTYATRGEYALAAAEMLESSWNRQTPARAGRLAQAMRTGSESFLEGAE